MKILFPIKKISLYESHSKTPVFTKEVNLFGYSSYPTSSGWYDKNIFTPLNLKNINIGTVDPTAVKTYYFIPLTKFDRSYFSRLYPDLEQVYKPDNADVILYDENSFTNNRALVERSTRTLSDIVGSHNSYYSWHHHSIDEATSNIYRNQSEPLLANNSIRFGSYPYLTIITKINHVEKFVNVHQFLKSRKYICNVANLTIDNVFTIINQVKSKDLQSRVAGIDSLISYTGYDLTKSLVVYFCKSYVGKNKEIYENYKVKYCSGHSTKIAITDLENIYQQHGKNTTKEDKDMFFSIVNSDVIKERLIAPSNLFNIEIKIEEKPADSKIETAQSDIEEFLCSQ